MEGKDEEADPRRFSPLDFPSAARATFFDELECAKEDEEGQHQHHVELYDQRNDLRQQALYYNSVEGRARNAWQQERGSMLMRDRLEFNISPPAIPRTATRRSNLFPLGEHFEQQQAAGSMSQPLHFEREPLSSLFSTTSMTRSSENPVAPRMFGPPINLTSHPQTNTVASLASYRSTAYQSGGTIRGTDSIMVQNVHEFNATNSDRTSNLPAYGTVGGTSSAFTSNRRSLLTEYPRQIPAYEASPDFDSSILTEQDRQSAMAMYSYSSTNLSQSSSTLPSPFSPSIMGSPQLRPQNVPLVFTPLLVEDTSTEDEVKLCLPVSTSDSFDSFQRGIISLSSPSRNRPSSGMSSIEESISSSTETETVGRGRSIRQARRSTRRGSRGRATSPGRGRSSSSVSSITFFYETFLSYFLDTHVFVKHLSGSSRRDRGRSTASPASYASGNTAGDENIRDQEKSPPPQNLRGDPFRSAKVKTELCRNFNSAKGCPFGDKCNYAHGEHELKFTKLMDLERAGLVDIEIFRTHPCPTWVATGACPFDQRCIGLHDPRIKSQEYSSWLPHAETMINKISNGVNVDSFYHERVASVYNLCPVYGYVPQFQRNSSDTEFSNEASFKHFYEHICNLERLKYQEVISGGDTLDEDIVLEIVLSLRAKKAGISYRYMPTHMLRGELCMVLQTKTFESRKNWNESISHNQTLLREVTEPSPGDLNTSDKRTIKVHEIAFGPVGDPSARNVSVWFDLQETDLTECTPQQAKHHKRSRHRLKTAKRTRGAKFPPYVDDDVCKGLILPFEHYQPRDKSAFDLVTSILQLRLRTIQILRDISENDAHGSAFRSKQDNDNFRNSVQELEKEIKDLNSSFSSQFKHWVTWSWPEQVLRNPIDDDTDVPPVDSEYEFNVYNSEYKRGDSDYLYGLGSVRSMFNLSLLSLYLPSLLWKSFMTNIQTQNDVSDEMNATVTVGNFYKVNRLPVFQLLSTGRQTNKKRPLPRLCQASANDIGDKVDFFESFLCSWDVTKKHYDEKLASQNISKEDMGPRDT